MSKRIVTSDKKDLLKQSLFDYFNNLPRLILFKSVVEKETEYSLRILEWFVSNYAKKHNIIYQVNKRDLNVFLDYKSQLKSFSKRQFDPFRRHDKFDIDYTQDGKKHSFATTVGQMNFFKWAIENNVLEYVGKHINAIKNDMNDSVNNKMEGDSSSPSSGGGASSDKNRRKRQPLSVAATRTCVKRYTKVIISFE